MFLARSLFASTSSLRIFSEEKSADFFLRGKTLCSCFQTLPEADLGAVFGHVLIVSRLGKVCGGHGNRQGFPDRSDAYFLTLLWFDFLLAFFDRSFACGKVGQVLTTDGRDNGLSVYDDNRSLRTCGRLTS